MKFGRRFFTVSIVLFPWLSSYATFFAGISLGDFLLLMNIPFLIYNNHILFRRGNPVNVFAIYYIYSIVVTSLTIVMGDEVYFFSIFKRTIKFGLFLMVMMGACKGLIEKKIFERCYHFMAIISCLAIFIQYMGYFLLNKYIMFKIPLLKFCNALVEERDYVGMAMQEFRPQSIFLEPAHYAYFLCIYIIFLLYKNEIDFSVKKLCEVFLYTVFMILSVSSTALIVAGLIWGLFCLQVIFAKEGPLKRIKGNIIGAGVCGIVLVFCLFSKSDNIRYAFTRMLYSVDATQASKVWNRLFRGMVEVKSLGRIEWFIGKGFGNLPEGTKTFSGINYILYYGGLFAFVLFVIWVICAFLYADRRGKTTLIVAVALNFSTPLIFSGLFIIYNIIISGFKDKQILID